MNILKITAENRKQYENTHLNYDGAIQIDAQLGYLS